MLTEEADINIFPEIAHLFKSEPARILNFSCVLGEGAKLFRHGVNEVLSCLVFLCDEVILRQSDTCLFFELTKSAVNGGFIVAFTMALWERPHLPFSSLDKKNFIGRTYTNTPIDFLLWGLVRVER